MFFRSRDLSVLSKMLLLMTMSLVLLSDSTVFALRVFKASCRSHSCGMDGSFLIEEKINICTNLNFKINTGLQINQVSPIFMMPKTFTSVNMFVYMALGFQSFPVSISPQTHFLIQHQDTLSWQPTFQLGDYQNIL